jgi:hypothetical protein
MDPILAAERLPKLAARAMRSAIVAAALRPAGSEFARGVTHRALVNDALIRFERGVQRIASNGIRPALLFAERDRIVCDLRAFCAGRLAARLFALRKRDVIAAGRAAAPFDAIVRGRRGGAYGVVFRRLAGDGRRLDAMRAIRHAAARSPNGRSLRGVLVYDFGSGTVRTLRCAGRPVELAAA